MKTILIDMAISILAASACVAGLFQLGQILEKHQDETEQRLSDREIQSLTEMRVMREWELLNGTEGK